MESHPHCLRDDDGQLDDERFNRVRGSIPGSNTVNGFGPYVRENGCAPSHICHSSGSLVAGFYSFSPSTPAVASETSQDSGFLSTPSCDSGHNNGSYFGPRRRTTLSSFGSVTSDALQDSLDDSAFQSDSMESSAQPNRLPHSEVEDCLSEECRNMTVTSGVVSTDDMLDSVNIPSGCCDDGGYNGSRWLQSPSINGVCDNSRFTQMLPSRAGQNLNDVCTFASSVAEEILKDALIQSVALGWSIQCSGQCSELSCREDRKRRDLSSANRRCKPTPNCSRLSCSSNLCWTPELPYSPNHSRISRLPSVSCSHDSIVVSQLQDDSSFIKEAVSHEILSSTTKKRRAKAFDPEIYSCPVDTLKPHQRRIFQPKAIVQQPRSGYPYVQVPLQVELGPKASKGGRRIESGTSRDSKLDRKSKDEPGTMANRHCNGDVIQVHSNSGCGHPETKLSKINTLSSAARKSGRKLDKEEKGRHRRSLSSNIRSAILALFTFRRTPKELGSCVSAENDFFDASQVSSQSPAGIKWGKICPLPSAPPLRHSSKFSAFSNPTQCHNEVTSNNKTGSQNDCKPRQSSLLFCLGHPRTTSFVDDQVGRSCRRKSNHSSAKLSASKRALPPLPNRVKGSPDKKTKKEEDGCDFASIIDKVKDYGWYWGPISGEAAEKVLSNEPDGSFIVRDSSDYHYIFSLTFRLNGVTRHVRIEHDQGNFSFGGFTRFKSQTIVDFIEKAVEHSRSGRYLFFLHRRPVLGPMRVQLLHPVSRFKHVQSLQHLCRFTIVNHVRRDLINSLPLPQRLKEYLSSPHYYSELVERCMSNEAEEARSNGQSPVSCSGHVTCSSGEGSGEVMGAAALSPTGEISLLPKQFSYQFVHGTDRSSFDDALESGPSRPDLLSPQSPAFLVNQSSPADGTKNIWPRSPDCHVSSFRSSQSSYQFSTTASEYSPMSPENVTRGSADWLTHRKLLKCLSLGNVCKPPRNCALCPNLLSALALETKSSIGRGEDKLKSSIVQNIDK